MCTNCTKKYNGPISCEINTTNDKTTFCNSGDTKSNKPLLLENR